MFLSQSNYNNSNKECWLKCDVRALAKIFFDLQPDEKPKRKLSDKERKNSYLLPRKYGIFIMVRKDSNEKMFIINATLFLSQWSMGYFLSQ